MKASFDRCATLREPSMEPGSSSGGSSGEEGEGEEQDSSESEGGIVWFSCGDSEVYHKIRIR